MKKKILWYSDFCVPTGFGNVAEALISRLKNKYDITVLAINYRGEPINIEKNPYYRFRDIPVYPAYSTKDYLGRQQLLNLIHQGDFDILFILQDTFNIVPLREELQKAVDAKGLKYVFYFPVDAELDREWVQTACDAHFPVTYTWYGQKEVQIYSIPVPYIYHGVDPVFEPISEEDKVLLRAQILQAGDDDFIIANVNRNQHRKDLPRTLLAFTEIKRRIPSAKLYLHTNLEHNAGSGHDLERFVWRYIPAEVQRSIIFPDKQVMAQGGLSRKFMAKLYGCFDVVISTSRGEGWGLSCTEAMACKVPVVMPRHTAFVEIVGPDQERGLLANCDEVDVNILDNERARPVVNIESLVDKVLQIQNCPDVARARTEDAYTWIKEHCDWDKIAEQWEEILGAEMDSTGR